MNKYTVNFHSGQSFFFNSSKLSFVYMVLLKILFSIHSTYDLQDFMIKLGYFFFLFGLPSQGYFIYRQRQEKKSLQNIYKRANVHKFPSANVHDVIGKLQNQAWPFYSMDGSYLNSQVSPASTNANNILRSIHKSPICINMFWSKFSQSRTPYTFHRIEAIMPMRNGMDVLCFPVPIHRRIRLEDPTIYILWGR